MRKIRHMTNAKRGNKGKKRFCRCKFFERECDDLGKYSWCRSDERTDSECDCDTIYEMNLACPYFERGAVSFMLDYSKFDKKKVEERKERIRKDLEYKEAEERATYLRLKAKYEGFKC